MSSELRLHDFQGARTIWSGGRRNVSELPRAGRKCLDACDIIDSRVDVPPACSFHSHPSTALRQPSTTHEPHELEAHRHQSQSCPPISGLFLAASQLRSPQSLRRTRYVAFSFLFKLYRLELLFHCPELLPSLVIMRGSLVLPCDVDRGQLTMVRNAFRSLHKSLAGKPRQEKRQTGAQSRRRLG